MFLESRLFRLWCVAMATLWAALFARFVGFGFWLDHWYYPAIMVLGAFVAGLTPEGGGAVAFPVLSVFLEIDRAMARDFSLMIQSVGMTSASVWILTRRNAPLPSYRPVLWFLPVAFAGFVLGMNWLQAIPTYLIQALFLSLILSFAVAYMASRRRGASAALLASGITDYAMLGLVLVAGGICASLFGTGTDIVLYTLLVTRFRMDAKIATQISILVMAGVSIGGYAWRAFWDAGLTAYQVQTWLCAYPVVLIMAPLGSYVLSRLDVKWMLRGVVLLNILQMAYFNLRAPSAEKLLVSAGLSTAFLALFWWALVRRRSPAGAGQSRSEMPRPQA